MVDKNCNNCIGTEIDCGACDFNMRNWKGKVEEKAIKFDQGKPQMSLIPPRALEEVAKALTYGASKYSPYNYLQGIGFDQRRLLDAALRHIYAHLRREDIDESGNSHLSHAIASLLMLLEAIKVGKIVDDRYKE